MGLAGRRSVRAGSSACCLLALTLLPRIAPAQVADSTDRSRARRDSVQGERVRRDSVAQHLEGVLVRERRAAARGYQATATRSALRINAPLLEVPQSVTVVTRGLIADQALQSMADMARVVPGLSVGLGEGHRDAPTLRGTASTGDFFVDGIRDDAQYLRDFYNTDRLEVLKGANAMAFGRGGGGGVINRVTRDADWQAHRAIVAEGGSFDHKRVTIDAGDAYGSLSMRVNGMLEESGGFRDAAQLGRTGINPVAAWRAGPGTIVRAGYEYFADSRTVDRGIPSFRRAPSPAARSAFFGDPRLNTSDATVHATTLGLDQALNGAVQLRHRSRLTDYGKFYQNTFPGAVSPDGAQVSIAGYNSSTDRRNVFHQTDLTATVLTGPVSHTVLLGAEFGAQRTESTRETAYFGDAGSNATSFAVPFGAARGTLPATFRRSASDADAFTRATVGAGFLQDVMHLGSHVDLVAGVRFESFRVRYTNNRNGTSLARRDELVSPRVGVVLKPLSTLSLYGSHAVSYLPGAGDQFTSLTVTTQTLQPEQFRNQEVGVKWDANSALSFTGALFQLDRTNTTAPDPQDATRVVQTGAQRTTGAEAGFTGTPLPRWQVNGGVAVQRARILSRTSAAPAGASAALVPHTMASLWNRVDVTRRIGVGAGVVHQTRSYAAIDNTVLLPAFTRIDGAIYVGLSGGLRLQANVENLLDTRYYATSHGNNNIMPGAPRMLRVSLSAGR